jgi:peroxiredoxin
MKGLVMKIFFALCLSCVLLLKAGLANSRETPEAAPEFEAKTTTGKTITLAQFRGQVVLLDFWASWCKPCQEEFPFLIDLYNENKDKNFIVLAINVDEDAAKMAAFLDKIHAPVKFPIVTDPQGKIPSLYKIDRMPTTILIAPNGEIRYKQGGFQKSSKEKLVQELKTLLADKSK